MFSDIVLWPSSGRPPRDAAHLLSDLLHVHTILNITSRRRGDVYRAFLKNASVWLLW